MIRAGVQTGRFTYGNIKTYRFLRQTTTKQKKQRVNNLKKKGRGTNYITCLYTTHNNRSTFQGCSLTPEIFSGL